MIPESINIKSTESVEEEAVQSASTPPVVPNNIYLKHPNEEEITDRINSNLNVFQINQLLTLVKNSCSPLHEALKLKSKVFIFGAGVNVALHI